MKKLLSLLLPGIIFILFGCQTDDIRSGSSHSSDIIAVSSASVRLHKNPDLKYDYFIIQDGKQIPVADYEVTLKRRPFTLVIVMGSMFEGVFANFSSKPDLYEAYIHNVSPEETNPIPLQYLAMAEYSKNPDEEIFIAEKEVHYLYYGDEDHRFSYIDEKNDVYYGFRIISNFRYLDNMDQVFSIKEYDKEHLYITLAYSTLSEDETQSISQRDAIKIKFED